MINLTLARENTLAIARAKSRRPPVRFLVKADSSMARRWLTTIPMTRQSQMLHH